MSTRDGMSQEEIAACEADQAEAEFYRDDDDPSCGKCGVKQSNHWLVHLPAIIVAVWGESCVNLQVFTDGTNSDDANTFSVKRVTSASYDGTETPQPRTWHWPENVAPDVPASPAVLSQN